MPTNTTTHAAPQMMRAQEAADYLTISTRKLWSLTKNQEIAVVHVGRLVRYRRQDLDAYIERAKVPAAAPAPSA